MFFSTFSYSQNSNNDFVLKKVEGFIINKQSDSATFYLSKANKSKYSEILSKIISKKGINYNQYYQFISSVSGNNEIDYALISNYINSKIAAPKNKEKINWYYSKIKWEQILKLCNLEYLDEANIENQKLQDYISLFDQNNKDVILIDSYASSYEITLHLIQNEIKEGLKKIDKNIEIAEKFNEKELKIISYYLKSDFLHEQNKLDEYILICEKGLEIESRLKKRSTYYYSTIIHLIDALIYKGNDNNRVVLLLEELYNNTETTIDSYSLYAKFLSKLDINSPLKKDILKKFKVNDTYEFCMLVYEKGKESLGSNDYYYLLVECSAALEKDNFLRKAIRFQEKAVEVNRKTYGKELSNSLANYKSSQLLKQNEIEVKQQKEKTFYLISILSILILFFIIVVYFLNKIIKQKIELVVKNKIIKKSLKEKELLIKEVHHRVKNNFQLVSSLLELQSFQIKDENIKGLFMDAKNRIKSMSVIHQKLYKNESGLINFNNYIELLLNETKSSYKDSFEVNIELCPDDVYFDFDIAIPLGLIVNELITNSFKHAFHKNRDNRFSISLVNLDGGGFKLHINDNGSGLNDTLENITKHTLGLRLVVRLVKQLQGNIKTSNENGFNVEIFFKDSKERRKID